MEDNQNPTQEVEKATLLDFQKQMDEYNKSHVTIEEYNKVVEQNNEYVKAMFDGKQQKKEEEHQEELKTKSIQELRNNLFGSCDYSNMEFWQNAIDLRDIVLVTENRDIFVGGKSSPQDSYEAAARVASVVKECLEKANGDSELFRVTFNNRVNDIQLPGFFKR